MPKNNNSNKPTAKRGRKKLSLYNRTVKYYWRVANTRPLLARKKDREQKVSYQENRLRLKAVYRKIQELQQQSNEPIFKGNVQKDYSLILSIYKLKPWKEDKVIIEEPLPYLLPFPDGQYNDERSIGSNYYDLPFFVQDEMNPLALETIFEFDCDDSGTKDGRRFTYTTIPDENGNQVPIKGKNLVEVLAGSELYWYCKREYDTQQIYCKFYIIERRGNEYVKYGMTGFTQGDGSVIGEKAIPKEKEESKEEKPTTESEAAKVQQLKTKEAEDLRLAKEAEERTKKTEYEIVKSNERQLIMQMFMQNKISEDTMLRMIDNI